MDIIVLLMSIVTVEALTELFFHAGPLQPIRLFLRQHLPWLYSSHLDTHLFDCPYCMSVWFSFLLILLYFTIPINTYIVFVLFFSLHRLSNFIHIIFSTVRDKQMDLRVNRFKDKGGN